MPFECFQCGECCANLGLVHTIQEDYGVFRFLIHNNYTGEETQVSIDPDKRDLFLDMRIFLKFPRICPFFRHRDDSGTACCTVHLTRPQICRDYECWRLLILNNRGRMAGKIRHIRSFSSDDPFLTKIWNRCIEPLQEPDDRKWEDEMIRILQSVGYSVRK